ALSRPYRGEIIEFGNCLGARWQHHPRLLGGRENVNIRRTEIRVVHGTDADEPDGRTGLRVVAPNRDSAGWTACDLLALAARRGRQDDFGLSGGVHDTIGFIERVEGMRGPGLALAPTAMTSMNNQWRSDQTISDMPARASTFHFQLHREMVISGFGLAQNQKFLSWAIAFGLPLIANVQVTAVLVRSVPLPDQVHRSKSYPIRSPRRRWRVARIEW